MPMYNLIEESNSYSKISGNLWQYYTDGPTLTDAFVPDNFCGNSACSKLNKK